MIHRRTNAGFTLLETLLAMSIMSLVLVVLASSASITARSYASVRDRMEQPGWKAGVDVAVRMIRVSREFIGKEDRLGFVGPMPDALEGPGLYFIELRAGAAGGLALYSRPRNATQRDAAEGYLDNVDLVATDQQVRFRFHDGSDWHTRWGNRRGEPRLIEMSIDTGEATGIEIVLVSPVHGRL